MESEGQVAVGKPRRPSLEEQLYHLVSSDYCGNDHVPLDTDYLKIKDDMGVEHVFGFTNDAFEVALGYPDKWSHMMRRQDFGKIVRWYLWRWAYGEWFGLRRRVYYYLLHRRVSRFTTKK